VSGLFVRRGWPLALVLCADWVPIEAYILRCVDLAGSPNPGTTVSALPPHALANSLASKLLFLSCCWQRSRLVESLYHHRPRHARNLIGQRHRRDLDWPVLHDTQRAPALVVFRAVRSRKILAAVATQLCGAWLSIPKTPQALPPDGMPLATVHAQVLSAFGWAAPVAHHLTVVRDGDDRRDPLPRDLDLCQIQALLLSDLPYTALP
jgi:hypothetical protein